jgi:heat shock protein HtpX
MARPTSFGRDTGLQLRMTLTLFLLGLVYAVLVGVVFASGYTFLLVLVGGMFLFQVFASDKLALHAMGAREVSPQEAPQLHAMVERLCVQANLPKPRIAVANTRMPNAFAIGRSPKKATVCATTGIMELLSPAELEGVMAHELTHVQNRDVMVMTIASFFATVAAYIVQFGFFFGGGGMGSSDDDSPSAAVVILVSVVVYVISFLLLQALSRYREFAADRGAAVITGRPSALSAALLKISGTMERIPQRDLRASGAGGVLHLPAAGEAVADEPLLDAPAAREARRGAQPPRGAAAGRGLAAPFGRGGRPHGAARHHLRQAQARQTCAGSAVRDEHGLCDVRDRAGDQQPPRRGDRLPSARDRRLRADRERHGRGRPGHVERQRHDRRDAR